MTLGLRRLVADKSMLLPNFEPYLVEPYSSDRLILSIKQDGLISGQSAYYLTADSGYGIKTIEKVAGLNLNS